MELKTLEAKRTPRRRELLRQAAYQRQRGLMVLMEDVWNPHNLAAIARSCDAFGVQTLAFTLENHKLFDPSQVGKIASSSANKWLDYRIFRDGTRDCLTTLKNEGWHILATVMDSDLALYDVDFTQIPQVAVMVGNEHAGLSPVAMEMADTCVTIPMQGVIRSLNVSVATAITLAEITRQRRASNIDFSLPEADALALYKDFLQR